MELILKNARGHTLDLINNNYFYLVNFDNQTAANTNLSTMTIGGTDGDYVNNIQAQARDVPLDFRIKSGVDVEEAKRAILKIIKLKQKATLIWTQNDKTVTISGVVQSVEMPRWNKAVTMQISLHCEMPFWEDLNYLTQQINEALGLHYFTDVIGGMLYFPAEGIPLGEYDLSRTRDFYNEGDVDAGLQIEILAYKTVTNPIIYNQDGEFFGVGTGTGSKKVVMQAGDKVIINTERGNKTVTLNGVNLYGKIKPFSTWIQLKAGENTLSINSDDDDLENVSFSLIYKQKYI